MKCDGCDGERDGLPQRTATVDASGLCPIRVGALGPVPSDVRRGRLRRERGGYVRAVHRASSRLHRRRRQQQRRSAGGHVDALGQRATASPPWPSPPDPTICGSAHSTGRDARRHDRALRQASAALADQPAASTSATRGQASSTSSAVLRLIDPDPTDLLPRPFRRRGSTISSGAPRGLALHGQGELWGQVLEHVRQAERLSKPSLFSVAKTITSASIASTTRQRSPPGHRNASGTSPVPWRDHEARDRSGSSC